MLIKLLTSCVITVAFNSVYAQKDSTPPTPEITGSVDMYFRYNLAAAKSHSINNFTSFTNSQNSFQLGMASIRVDHEFGKASATVDLGFGPRAEEFSYADPGHPTLFALKQAFLSYAISDKIKITMGKWMTHIGYELTDAYLNRNYSMDYMFSYGPFSHTGLKVDIRLGAKCVIMAGVANTTDAVAAAGSRKYALAQFATGTRDEKLKVYLNYEGSYGGSMNLSQFDIVLTDAITDKFSLGYNGTVQSVKPGDGPSSAWWGSAAYLTLDPTKEFGITLRSEYFDNKKAVAPAPPTSIFDITLSPNFRIGNLKIIPEIRLDNAKNKIFKKSETALTQSTVTCLVAATYHF